jgi:hypothetical protein
MRKMLQTAKERKIQCGNFKRKQLSARAVVLHVPPHQAGRVVCAFHYTFNDNMFQTGAEKRKKSRQ